MKKNLLIFIVFFFVQNYFAQKNDLNDINKIITEVVNHNNPNFPIVDELSPSKFQSKFLREQIEKKLKLNKIQKKILKKGIKNDQPIIIDKNDFPQFKFLDNKLILNAFKNLNNSGNLELIQENKPFYFLSKPIIFDDLGIAIIDMDLWGSFGAIYILKKEKGEWKIVDDIGKWYS